MNYPLISEYIESIKSAEDNFEELSYLRPVLGDDGLPIMTSGNFAVVFKMKDKQSGKFYAVKCFTKEQEGRAEAYREIAKALENVSSPYILSIRYLDKELFVDTDQTTETEFPVLLMDWVEGKTLDKYLRENLDDKFALEMLAYRFSQLAQWLIPQPYAHGDLKPDNILVREDGSLVLVDYDGMYVPFMKGQKARELGSPDFCHPLRTENDFDEHIDDFPLISILFSLKAISVSPQLLDKYGTNDRLLLSRMDYLAINKCDVIKLIFPSENNELNRICSTFIIILSDYRSITLPTQLYSCHISLNCLEHYYEQGEKFKGGIEAEQDGNLSVLYYRIAAEFGFAKAQYKLGVCYRDGFGVDLDINKALLWFEKAAELGDVNAMYDIADIYTKTKNPMEMSAYTNTVIQAEHLLSVNKNNIDALRILGICLRKGKGGEKDLDKGLNCLKEAAEKGDSNAQAWLGRYYYMMWLYGDLENQEEAVKWLEMSAKQGNSLGQRRLGDYYLRLKNTEENKKKAVYWLERSATQGDSKSQNLLGCCLSDKVVNYDMAFHWFEESAKRGNRMGEYNLAVCYEYGNGTVKNRDKARYWYEKAEKKGVEFAEDALKRLEAEDNEAMELRRRGYRFE